MQENGRSGFEACNEPSFYFLASLIKALLEKQFCKLLFEAQPACVS